MTQKLYRVEAVYEYFVMAEDEDNALDSCILRKAVGDAIDPDSHTAVLDEGKITPSGWGPQCLVYTTDDEELTLAEARRLQEARA